MTVITRQVGNFIADYVNSFNLYMLHLNLLHYKPFWFIESDIFIVQIVCVCVDIFDGKISQINSMHKIPQNSRWSTLTSHIHDALYYCVFFSAKRRTFLWHACECINTHLVGVFCTKAQHRMKINNKLMYSLYRH